MVSLKNRYFEIKLVPIALKNVTMCRSALTGMGMLGSEMIGSIAVE